VLLEVRKTINTEYSLNADGLTKALNAVERSCNGGKYCFHYVIVTNEERASQFQWTKPSGVGAQDDERFGHVRQWVLVVKKRNDCGVYTWLRYEK
jgi:hypothetical protein